MNTFKSTLDEDCASGRQNNCKGSSWERHLKIHVHQKLSTIYLCQEWYGTCMCSQLPRAISSCRLQLVDH